MLSEGQIERYSRHILLRPIGGRGQLRLLASCVRVPGHGRTAQEAARYLAAAGVGALVLDDALMRGWATELRGLNPDTRLFRPSADAAPPIDDEMRATPDDDRLAGAMAATNILLRLSGAADPRPLKTDGREAQ